MIKKKTMKKYLLTLLLLAAVLPMTSCRRAIEKARENIRFEGIEKVEPQGLTGVDVFLLIDNGTGYKLVLNDAHLEVFYAGSRVATVLLREGVEVPRHTAASIPTRWQVKISDPLALYVMMRKLRAGDLSRIEVSFAAEGRGGPAPVKIEREKMPLSDFLRTFGLTFEDVKNFLRK